MSGAAMRQFGGGGRGGRAGDGRGRGPPTKTAARAAPSVGCAARPHAPAFHPPSTRLLAPGRCAQAGGVCVAGNEWTGRAVGAEVGRQAERAASEGLALSLDVASPRHTDTCAPPPTHTTPHTIHRHPLHRHPGVHGGSRPRRDAHPVHHPEEPQKHAGTHRAEEVQQAPQTAHGAQGDQVKNVRE